VAILVYKIQVEYDNREKFPDFATYSKTLLTSMRTEYPLIKMKKRVIFKSKDELEAEAVAVKKILT
jgi:hypothetical protein